MKDLKKSKGFENVILDNFKPEGKEVKQYISSKPSTHSTLSPINAY